jgi:chorismate dehydratase
MKTRLGAISFVNTVPIYSNYTPDPEVELVYDVPARLNASILSGELEVSPVSSACFLRNQDKLVLLYDLSVSSPGAVESVIFLSDRPLEAMLDAPVIHVPNDSETSVMLLAYLLKEATGVDLRPWFKIYEAANYERVLKESGNALIIGDNALMVQESGASQGYHFYDLSTLWKEKTGLPFVFAVWVARREWAEAHPDQLQTLNTALREARNAFFSAPSIFKSGLDLARTRSCLPVETLERYYRQCLTYGLDAPHLETIARFDRIIRESEFWDEPAEAVREKV